MDYRLLSVNVTIVFLIHLILMKMRTLTYSVISQSSFDAYTNFVAIWSTFYQKTQLNSSFRDLVYSLKVFNGE